MVMGEDPYLIPGTRILRNRLGLEDPLELDRMERLLVTQRTIEGCPSGDLDLPHLRSIHRHLFQDVYDWAGELRTLEISKGGSQFQLSRFIETGMEDIHRRLVQQSFLKDLPREVFAEAAAKIIGDVNYVHPFREGNGRSQLEFLAQLGRRAGHELDPDLLDPKTWQAASKMSFDGDYGPMASAILFQAMTISSIDDEERRRARTAAWQAMQHGRGR